MYCNDLGNSLSLLAFDSHSYISQWLLQELVAHADSFNITKQKYYNANKKCNRRYYIIVFGISIRNTIRSCVCAWELAWEVLEKYVCYFLLEFVKEVGMFMFSHKCKYVEESHQMLNINLFFDRNRYNLIIKTFLFVLLISQTLSYHLVTKLCYFCY